MIRNATVEDSDAVAAVYIESRKIHVPFAPLIHSEHEIRSWIRHQLIPQGNVLVVELKNEIVGMLAFSESEGHSWIDHLYIRPNMTGQGHGSVLLEVALGKLNRPIRLYTFQASEDARRFYEKKGFVASKFSDGRQNEERCPDVLYILEN